MLVFLIICIFQRNSNAYIIMLWTPIPHLPSLNGKEFSCQCENCMPGRRSFFQAWTPLSSHSWYISPFFHFITQSVAEQVKKLKNEWNSVSILSESWRPSREAEIPYQSKSPQLTDVTMHCQPHSVDLWKCLNSINTNSFYILLIIFIINILVPLFKYSWCQHQAGEVGTNRYNYENNRNFAPKPHYYTTKAMPLLNYFRIFQILMIFHMF